ncbi:MAG: RnfABCDGE type electron transport complex subunit D [Balneolaceae bacterium]|nr:RnfABCDGE type electron transport complex subunit D [Balneolaceae bacterium]MCH8548621.1 hypothetical protein [Balneolaceae bacterium]
MSRTTSLPKPFDRITFPKSYIGPLLISGILLAAHISFGILDTWTKLFAAIGTAFIVESVLHKAVTGRWRDLSSAYVSGISAGILVRSPMIWPFALCAAISIASKYVFRVKGQHIWNPTNFGIVVMLIIASDSMAVLSIQWGNNMWAMLVIWLVGLYTISKVNRFNICLSYILAFIAFAWVRAAFTGGTFAAEVAPLTGPMYQLFVLFMITDPKTTVRSKTGQSVVAVMIAFTEMLFRFGEAVYAPFYALFVVGPIALLIEMWWEERRQNAKQESASPRKVQQ